MEGVTAAIENGDIELSGGYEDGKISGSIAFNMQKVTVDGTEVTASVKYEIEIDLSKIGAFFKKLFEIVRDELKENFVKYVLLFAACAAGVIVTIFFSPGLTIAEIGAAIIKLLTDFAKVPT